MFYANRSGKSYVPTGQGIQVYRNATTEENVAAELEDEASCFSYCDRVDPHYRALYLWGVRLWKVKPRFLAAASAVFKINKHVFKAAVGSIEYC